MSAEFLDLILTRVIPVLIPSASPVALVGGIIFSKTDLAARPTVHGPLICLQDYTSQIHHRRLFETLERKH
jgi:hypothetical protein